MDLKMMSSKESLSKKWTKLSAVTLLGLATLLPSFGHAKASRSDGYSMKMYCKFEVLKKKTHVGKNWKSESLMTQAYEKNFTVGFQSYVVTSNKEDWNRAINIF
ncbi:MAG TPA: hypothetical protein DCL41_07095, partial [Bdellovibrionales bacterium]|nr:hypothetical protein [Bdellovibrionales bacterium]